MGRRVGEARPAFEKNGQGIWHVSDYRARLIPVTSDIAEDPEVAAVVNRYWRPIAARYGEVIGEAAADFIEKGGDLAPYNLVSDLVRETFKTEIEFENIGGVRSDLVQGKITKGDLVILDPFDNTVVTFRISGRQLKEILLKEKPAVSGIRYRVENGRLVKATVGGRPIRNEHIYTGATNSYFARNALRGIKVTNTGKQRLDVLVEAVRRKGIVKPVYDGRRVVIDR